MIPLPTAFRLDKLPIKQPRDLTECELGICACWRLASFPGPSATLPARVVRIEIRVSVV